ncbi:MAG: restriction endonuclease [Lachnospiraceae bacterium]|nr:restriction endonuclease [Lachnospiraceae bacterium]
MNLHFNELLAKPYKSKSQKIRVMSENWITDNMFCPCCGNPHITGLGNNSPVADMQCDSCGEIFELKSKEGNIGRKITDGAYSTMIDRITSITNPELFVMQYSKSLDVTELTLIPKFFFVPDIIEKRKPLARTARRAGWVGCNILYNNIPEQGKISIIHNGRVNHIENVVDNYKHIKNLQRKSLESRGWLMDVLHCVNSIKENDFYLRDVYAFAEQLQSKHINNHNIEAKIRQQLQFLRDKGFIEFLERGHYRKLS